MGGGDLNLKKSWHPQTFHNIEKVWKAEQRAITEKRKIDQLLKERREEQQLEHAHDAAASTGFAKKSTKLDWMYAGSVNKINSEEYLLGKQVDKEVLKPDDDDLKKEAGVFDVTQNANSMRDTARKVREDPMFLIKKKEQEQIKQLRDNPVRMKQLRKLMEKQGGKKVKKHKKHKHKKSKHRDSGGDHDDDEWHVKGAHHSNGHSQRRSRSRSHSRSPRRRRKDIRSPRRRSRSRSSSRSPRRRRSKSPVSRRKSPSPRRSPSRSPSRRRSRSPARRRSGSPAKRRSRSPAKRRSDSSERRVPVRGRSKSPVRRRRSRSPARRRSRSPSRRNRSPPRNNRGAFYRGNGRGAPPKPKTEEEIAAEKQKKREEAERKLKAMQEDAEWHEQEKTRRIQEHVDVVQEEQAVEKKKERASFIEDMNKQSFGSNLTGTVEDRIKRNIHNVQRTASDLNSNSYHRR